LKKAGANIADQARDREGYLLISQLGIAALAEKAGRWVDAEVLLPCEADEAANEDALLIHEASKCLPVMWDKVEIGGPPLQQVTDASGSFQQKHDHVRVIDDLLVHPICSRMGLALNVQQMSKASYPNPDQWAISSKFNAPTAWDAMMKGNPQWVAKNLMDFCMNPDTAVCTSFTVCWAMLTRHITKLIHPFCDEKLRAFPEMPIIDQ